MIPDTQGHMQYAPDFIVLPVDTRLLDKSQYGLRSGLRGSKTQLSHRRFNQRNLNLVRLDEPRGATTKSRYLPTSDYSVLDTLLISSSKISSLSLIAMHASELFKNHLIFFILNSTFFLMSDVNEMSLKADCGTTIRALLKKPY